MGSCYQRFPVYGRNSRTEISTSLAALARIALAGSTHPAPSRLRKAFDDLGKTARRCCILRGPVGSRRRSFDRGAFASETGRPAALKGPRAPPLESARGGRASGKNARLPRECYRL